MTIVISVKYALVFVVVSDCSSKIIYGRLG